MRLSYVRPAFFGLLFVATLGCSSAQVPSAVAAKAPGRYVQKLTSGGRERSYIIRVPKSYDGSKPIPVVVALHGWTSNAEQAEQFFGLVEKGEAEGFVTVFPQGLGQTPGWNAGFINLSGIPDLDDGKFISDLLDEVEKEVKIDPDREYVCGHSNGAMLANYVGATMSQRVAAIGAVSGTIGVGTKTIPIPAAPVSVILIHGKADPTVAYEKSARALLKGVGAEDTAQWWAQKDGCNPDPKTVKSADGNVTTETFGGGRGDAEVTLVSVNDGSHVVPLGTSKLKAADLLWDFFKSHPKRGR